MNEELLNEIRTEILDYYKKSEKEKGAKVDIETTLDAISEVTGLSLKEINPIAKKVIQEYNVNKKKSRLFRIRFFMLSIITTMIIGLLAYYKYSNPFKGVQTTLFITKELTSRPLVAGKVETLIKVNEKFYAYVHWIFDSIGGTYHAQLILKDSTGRIAKTCTVDTTPTSYNWAWYCPHTFKENIDTVGNWKYEVYLDKHKVAETAFEIQANK